MNLGDIAAAWGPALSALSGTLGQLANQSIAFDLAKYKHENGMTRSQEGQTQGQNAIDPKKEKRTGMQEPQANDAQFKRNEWIEKFLGGPQ